MGDTADGGEPRRLHGQFLRQADACDELGSPFYGTLLRHAAGDLQRGGVVAAVLTGYDGRPADDAVSLRLLGAVHRLALSGQAGALAAHYPNLGGDGDADAVWPLVAGVLSEHRDAVRDGLTRPPQTNEVGRAAGLVGVLHQLLALRPLPVRLLEIGASGGLNLRADRFRFAWADAGPSVGSGAVGPADSPLQLPDAWRGRCFRATEVLDVVERLGCDPHPVDPATDDGALTLMSYVWPDQAARWSRLRAALEVARTTAAEVVAQRAADFLADVRPVRGQWTVVWHSVMWQYLSPAEQDEVTTHIDRAGALASVDAPLARVTLEPYGPRFVVTARTWPELGIAAGREVLNDGQAVVGEAAPHGVPVRWL